MQDMIEIPEFNRVWLEHARDFKQYNHFRICRLTAYAAWHLYDPKLAAEAWEDLWSRKKQKLSPVLEIKRVSPPEAPVPLDEDTSISTNDAASWSLDAIYMQEVIPQ